MLVAIGIGCDHGAAFGTLEAALAAGLDLIGPVDVHWLATIDRKGDEHRGEEGKHVTLSIAAWRR